VTSVSLLVLAVVLAALTLNAYRPIRRVRALLIPSFGAAMFVSELPFHVLALALLAGLSHVVANEQPPHDSLGALALVLLALSKAGVPPALPGRHPQFDSSCGNAGNSAP